MPKKYDFETPEVNDEVVIDWRSLSKTEAKALVKEGKLEQDLFEDYFI